MGIIPRKGVKWYIITLNYWDLSECGYIDIKNNCSFVWQDHFEGNQRYIIQKVDRGRLGRILEDLMVIPPDKH